ncbi:MAG: ferrochelatase [Verrucomicrobiales bacterium]|jgi:ferrochelatase|nr:ferrochelatase [Verrucomicrobiales bacterium]
MNPKRGILLVNLGSPEAPSAAAVRRYLRELLMDPRVLDLNFPARWLLVHGLILPRRPRRVARHYQRIWTDAGSPLTVISENTRRRLQEQTRLPVALGMRYGRPDIFSGLAQLRLSQPPPEEILLVPLYPHYTPATWDSAVDRTREELVRLGWRARLTVLPPFYRRPDYLAALTVSIRDHLTVSDHVLFSYHGVPLRHLRHRWPGDPADYREQCHFTTGQIARRLALPPENYSTTFQSRFGREPWCQPCTAAELARLADRGVKKLAVVCPSFVSDCLETLDEIGNIGKEIFLARGGQSFQLIPCLNEHPLWVNALRDWIENYRE